VELGFTALEFHREALPLLNQSWISFLEAQSDDANCFRAKKVD
jgi:hypothetical protein